MYILTHKKKHFKKNARLKTYRQYNKDNIKFYNSGFVALK